MIDIKYTFVINPGEVEYNISMKSYQGDVCTKNEFLIGLTLNECIAAQQAFINSNN